MKHPCGIRKNESKSVTYSNRGMGLEHDINLSNEYYLIQDKAVIHKKPTPITIVKVDYPSRLEAVIKEAYFKTPSTTDYNGIYKGKYIDFEAKLYLLKAEDLLEFIQKNTRKSIPISYFETHGYSIKYTYNPRIDYLKIVDHIYGGDVWKNFGLIIVVTF